MHGCVFRQVEQFLSLEIVAHEMHLVVENELAGEAVRALRRRTRLRRLGPVDSEERTEDVVHRQERGRHAATGSQKLAPIEAEFRRDHIGDFLDALLDAALLGRLWQRVELAVRDDLGRHRRLECGSVRRLGSRQLGLAQQQGHRIPPLGQCATRLRPWIAEAAPPRLRG